LEIVNGLVGQLAMTANASWSFPLEPRSMHKAKWSTEEDDQLRQAIEEFGTGSWTEVSRRVPTRTGKQCRERWTGHLAPTVSKNTWHPEEDAALCRAHQRHGNQWTLIAAQIPGRSSLGVKNRWNWLARHTQFLEARVSKSRPAEAIPDVFDRRKPCTIALEPLSINDGLFGSRFQEFQAKMFSP
jgi:hypothetical protein